jgi:hypothetical protein
MSAHTLSGRNHQSRLEEASYSRINIGQEIPCDTSLIPGDEEKTALLVWLGIEGRPVWVKAKVKRSGVML